jgi:hypothetical protein
MYTAPASEAYRDVLAEFRRNLVESDGKQPGDPVRGADAILAIVNAENPPLRFPMGAATLSNVRHKLDAMQREIAAWEKLSLATSFPD